MCGVIRVFFLARWHGGKQTFSSPNQTVPDWGLWQNYDNVVLHHHGLLSFAQDDDNIIIEAGRREHLVVVQSWTAKANYIVHGANYTNPLTT